MCPVLSALRHRLHRLSWIALLAIFGLAMVPTISHALARVTGTSAWTEVCTPQGTQLVALDETGSGPVTPAAGGSHLDHCPLCGLGGSPVAPPPVAAPVTFLIDLGNATPTLFLRAPRPLFAWAAAQPRAPPLRA
jgi:Protein of unknown function (DUF2946)